MNDVIGSIILEGAFTSEDSTIISSAKSRRLVGEGTIQDMDVENRNKRIYAKVDLTPEINGPRMKELIEAKQFRGHAGHPLSDDLVVQQTIDPKLVCVQFDKVWTTGNRVKAQFKGTNNDYGEYFDRDLRDGCKPAFSLRALGTIEQVNNKAYVKNIKIITWDHVIYPSHKTAYTEKIVSESAMLGKETASGIVVPHDDPGRIIPINKTDANTLLNKLQRESANMGNILESFGDFYNKVVVISENKILLTNEYGDRMYANLENHVENIIMDYIYRK